MNTATKSKNQPTQIMLDKLVERFTAMQQAGEKTPYTTLTEARDQMYPNTKEWCESSRRAALQALAEWVGVSIMGMLSIVRTEIATAGKNLAETSNPEPQKLGTELSQSLGFIEAVFLSWYSQIDFQLIAEELFNACEAAEKNPAEPAPKLNMSLMEELVAKYKKPSAN